MGSTKIASFKISADFGFFKKPDSHQSGRYLTYNFPPKPTLLGMFGAICGYRGFPAEKGHLPEFYEKLKDIKLGIEPIGFPFRKIVNYYNNSTGHANLGMTLQVWEQLLVKPRYRIYFLSSVCTQELETLLKNRTTYFNPYLGKNEFPVTISDFKVENASELKDTEKLLTVVTTFLPSGRTRGKSRSRAYEGLSIPDDPKSYFENSPVAYGADFKYKLELFKYSTKAVSLMEINQRIGHLYAVGETHAFLF